MDIEMVKFLQIAACKIPVSSWREALEGDRHE